MAPALLLRRTAVPYLSMRGNSKGFQSRGRSRRGGRRRLGRTRQPTGHRSTFGPRPFSVWYGFPNTGDSFSLDAARLAAQAVPGSLCGLIPDESGGAPLHLPAQTSNQFRKAIASRLILRVVRLKNQFNFPRQFRALGKAECPQRARKLVRGHRGILAQLLAQASFLHGPAGPFQQGKPSKEVFRKLLPESGYCCMHLFGRAPEFFRQGSLPAINRGG